MSSMPVLLGLVLAVSFCIDMACRNHLQAICKAGAQARSLLLGCSFDRATQRHALSSCRTHNDDMESVRGCRLHQKAILPGRARATSSRASPKVAFRAHKVATSLKRRMRATIVPLTGVFQRGDK